MGNNLKEQKQKKTPEKSIQHRLCSNQLKYIKLNINLDSMKNLEVLSQNLLSGNIRNIALGSHKLGINFDKKKYSFNIKIFFKEKEILEQQNIRFLLTERKSESIERDIVMYENDLFSNNIESMKNLRYALKLQNKNIRDIDFSRNKLGYDSFNLKLLDETLNTNQSLDFMKAWDNDLRFGNIHHINTFYDIIKRYKLSVNF